MTTDAFIPVALRRAVSTVRVPGEMPRWALVLLASLSLCSPLLRAADVEVAGVVGGTTINEGGGTHPTFGGTVALGFADHFHVFGELNHNPMLSVGSTDANGNPLTVNVGLTNFGGGVDYSFGSSDSKVRPYVLLAFGDGRIGGSAEGVGASVNSFYTGFGGGARIYLGKHWGVKPEIRVNHYIASVLGITGTYTGVYYTGGVFYQFGE